MGNPVGDLQCSDSDSGWEYECPCGKDEEDSPDSDSADEDCYVADVPLHRYFNPATNDHLYTACGDELGVDDACAEGWNYEGIIGYMFCEGCDDTVPLHRLWNEAGNDHFYTTNPEEAEACGFNSEGVIGHLKRDACDGFVPLNRLWHEGNVDHFYTSDCGEAEGVVESGFANEGIIGYLRRG